MTDPTVPEPTPTPAASVPPVEPVTPPAATPPTTPPATPTTPSYASAPAYSPATAAVGPKQTLSLVSMILGIIGILGAWISFIPIIGSILGLFIPAAAIVLGLLGRSREPGAPRGFWMAGIICGIVGLAIAVISLIGWIILLAVGSANSNY